MAPNDFARFKSVLCGMGEIYGKEISPVLLDAYWVSFRDWTMAEFEEATSYLLRVSQFMPRPSEYHALKKAARLSPEEAWGQVLANVKSSQYRRGVTVGGTVDDAVRALGGYQAVGMCDTDKLHFLEKQFRDLYGSLEAVAETRKALPSVAGALALPNLKVS